MRECVTCAGKLKSSWGWRGSGAERLVASPDNFPTFDSMMFKRPTTLFFHNLPLMQPFATVGTSSSEAVPP
jgi:hypothetical protein